MAAETILAPPSGGSHCAVTDENTVPCELDTKQGVIMCGITLLGSDSLT